MKNYENDNFFKQKCRQQLRRRAIRRRISFSLLVCSCLVVLFAATFLGRTDLYNAVEQPELFPIAKVGKSVTGLSTNLKVRAENATNEDKWCLILVNKWNYIPDDYEVELIELSSGESVDKRIYPALQEMFDAARNDNIYLIAASGYRTTKKQQHLMDEKIGDYKIAGLSAKEAKVKAEAWVAIPGTSEHQLGISVDIKADGINSAGNEVYEWLAQNAHKFGFICRYPSDKTEITGVINEPWHYRYVGIEAATKIQIEREMEFPETNIEEIKGVVATISEGWIDLKFKNDTKCTYQIAVTLNEENITGTIFVDMRPQVLYRVTNGSTEYFCESSGVYEYVEVDRAELDADTGEISEKHTLYTNKCKICYPLPEEVAIKEVGRL